MDNRQKVITKKANSHLFQVQCQNVELIQTLCLCSNKRTIVRNKMPANLSNISNDIAIGMAKIFEEKKKNIFSYVVRI